MSKVYKFKVEKIMILRAPKDKFKSDPPKHGYIAKVVNIDRHIMDQVIKLSKD